MTSFQELLERHSTREKRDPFRGVLLALDPGETTGIALFSDLRLRDYTEIKGNPALQGDQILGWILQNKAKRIVVEDYRVYKWKAKHHTWSDLHTPRLIGVIEYLAYTTGTQLQKQPAHVAKQFCTDEKLLDWGFFQKTKGQRHARDAIRHGCYYLLFNKYLESKS